MSVHLLKKIKLIAIHTHTLKIMYTVFDVSMYMDKNFQFRNFEILHITFVHIGVSSLKKRYIKVSTHLNMRFYNL